MTARIVRFLSASLAVTLAACSGEPDRGAVGVDQTLLATEVAERAAPPVGACPRMTKPFMSTTFDSGATFIPFNRTTARRPVITTGLAGLDDKGALVVHAGDSFWGSMDDGCTWVEIHSSVVGNGIPGSGRGDAHGIFRVVAGPDGYAYGWEDNGDELYQIRHIPPGARWTKVRLAAAPLPNMHGFAVDAADPMRIRAAGDDAQIYESLDGGTSWIDHGVPARHDHYRGYVVAFDANDLDHAVYGRVYGAYVTFDGGQSWLRSVGLTSDPRNRVNLFNAVISPVDGNTVFAMGLEIETGARHIYASTDGGRVYRPVADHGSDGVYLTNGPFMMCDPYDSDVVRFLFSPSPAFGATRFFTLDLSGGISTIYNHTTPEIRVMMHSRCRRGAIHVGFDHVYPTLAPGRVLDAAEMVHPPDGR
jgi:hypothetical protein